VAGSNHNHSPQPHLHKLSVALAYGANKCLRPLALQATLLTHAHGCSVHVRSVICGLAFSDERSEGGIILKAGQRTTVASAVAAENEATMATMVAPTQPPEISPNKKRRLTNEAARAAASCLAPAVHALAVAAVVDPRWSLQSREMKTMGTLQTDAPKGMAHGHRKSCCHRND
jgi:hypothetical protein